jgi:hypothetical protein
MKAMPYYEVATILPTLGGGILRLAMAVSLLSQQILGTGFKIWKLVGLLCYVFPNWKACPIVGPDGRPFCVDLSDDSGFNLITRGFQTHAIKSTIGYLPKDAVALDIGANVGCWSRLIANHVTSGHVYAFEPSPQTFVSLIKNASVSYVFEPH